MLGDNTRRCSPGDIVNLTGIFLPVPITGFRAIRAGLISDTYVAARKLYRRDHDHHDHHHDHHHQTAAYTPLFRYLEATHVEQTKKAYDQVEIEGTAAMELAKEPDCYTILASSIAPEIYGHLDVKKSLLLQVRSRAQLCSKLQQQYKEFALI